MSSAGPGPRARRALLAGYVLCTFLAFPHPVAGRVVDLGWVFAWLAPACLVAALHGLGPRAAARHAFLAGLAAHTAVLHWIYVVTVTYGHAPRIAGVLAPIGLAAYIAAFSAAFGAGAGWLGARGAAGAFGLAALWTALDHLRSFALTGFPWATLGYAQHENAALLPLVRWTGVYGLSFVSVLGGAALAGLVRAPHARGPLLALASVGALHVAGALSAAPDAAPDAVTARLAVLQGNIDQGVKWSPSHALRTLEIYERLTRRAVERGARVVVWPETAVPGSLERDPLMRGRVLALADATAATLVVGGVGVEGERESMRFFDSIFVVEPERGITARYDKAHLVPFGEYVPLRALIGRVAGAVARGIAPDDVSRGERPRALSIPARDAATLPAGVPICYELLFPDLVRRFVGSGAGVLLAVTNDAWYGRTGAPYQFLAITALRSAENGVWTARAANTGVSAFIDARGRVQERTAIFEEGLLVRDVPILPPPAGGTFYTRHGDVFAYACWIGIALLALRRRRAPGRGA